MLSSVAGDRGRRSNYVYGSAKGGLNVFLEGLRQRLHVVGVRVMTVMLGPIHTKMTEGLLPRPFLICHAPKAAQAIHRGYHRKRDVTYVPARWRLIMGIVRMVPTCLYKRLNRQ